MAYIEYGTTAQHRDNLLGRTEEDEEDTPQEPRLSGGVTLSVPQAKEPTPSGTPTPISTTPAAQPQAAEAPEASPLPAASQPTALAAPRQDLGFGTSGSLKERLISPLRSGIGAQREAVETTGERFREEAGPERTFESAGGEQILGRALEAGGEKEPARQLVSAEYQGPRFLDAKRVQEIQDAQATLRQRQEALRTGGGLQGLIGMSVPGLTAGQARFEAKKLYEDRGLRDELAGFRPEVREVAGQLREEDLAARALAERREAQEAAIAEESKGYLRGRRGDVAREIEADIATKEEEQEAARQAYAKWLETGTLEDLTAAGGDRGLFETDTTRAVGEAEARYQEILDDPRFAGVAQYDPLELTVSPRGRETYGFTPRDEAGEPTDKSTYLTRAERQKKYITKEERELLEDRQRELEQEFGVGHTRKMLRRRLRLTPEQADEWKHKPGAYREAGIATFGEGGKGLETFQGADPREYTEFDPGMSPARENVATEDQTRIFNSVNDLLGEVDRISEAQPFRAAKLIADGDRYLADEEMALEQRRDTLNEKQAGWLKTVKRARRKYRKKRHDTKVDLATKIVAHSLLGVGGFAVY